MTTFPMFCCGINLTCNDTYVMRMTHYDHNNKEKGKYEEEKTHGEERREDVSLSITAEETATNQEQADSITLAAPH